jgi:hypothetical protein
MGRPAKITAVVFGLFVFLGISLLLTRALVGSGNERAAVLEVLRAQARGDIDGVLAELDACRAEPACVQTVRQRAATLERPGEVEILQYEPSVDVALTRQQGTGRVAWRTDERTQPVVQCVKVRREGPLSGGSTELLAISSPIEPTASC